MLAFAIKTTGCYFFSFALCVQFLDLIVFSCMIFFFLQLYLLEKCCFGRCILIRVGVLLRLPEIVFSPLLFYILKLNVKLYFYYNLFLGLSSIYTMKYGHIHSSFFFQFFHIPITTCFPPNFMSSSSLSPSFSLLK